MAICYKGNTQWKQKKQIFIFNIIVLPFSIFFEIQTTTLLLLLMGSEAGTELWIIFYPAKIKLSLSLHVVALVGQSNGGHCVLSFSNYVCLGGGMFKYVKLWMIALLRAETIKPSCLRLIKKKKINRILETYLRDFCLHFILIAHFRHSTNYK